MTFYICRHGETENNKARRLSGWIDTPLTELGEQQALASAAKAQALQIEKIVSSDLGRAFTTAYIIARHLGYQDEIDRLQGLREVSYGDWGNHTYHSFPDMTVEEQTDFIPPNGESLAQMQQRVLGCIAKLTEKYADKQLLIVAHDGTINALRANFDGESMGQADKTHNPQDVIFKIEFSGGKVTGFAQL